MRWIHRFEWMEVLGAYSKLRTSYIQEYQCLQDRSISCVISCTLVIITQSLVADVYIITQAVTLSAEKNTRAHTAN